MSERDEFTPEVMQAFAGTMRQLNTFSVSRPEAGATIREMLMQLPRQVKQLWMATGGQFDQEISLLLMHTFMHVTAHGYGVGRACLGLRLPDHMLVRCENGGVYQVRVEPMEPGVAPDGHGDGRGDAVARALAAHVFGILGLVGVGAGRTSLGPVGPCRFAVRSGNGRVYCLVVESANGAFAQASVATTVDMLAPRVLEAIEAPSQPDLTAVAIGLLMKALTRNSNA